MTSYGRLVHLYPGVIISIFFLCRSSIFPLWNITQILRQRPTKISTPPRLAGMRLLHRTRSLCCSTWRTHIARSLARLTRGEEEKNNPQLFPCPPVTMGCLSPKVRAAVVPIAVEGSKDGCRHNLSSPNFGRTTRCRIFCGPSEMNLVFAYP